MIDDIQIDMGANVTPRSAAIIFADPIARLEVMDALRTLDDGDPMVMPFARTVRATANAIYDQSRSHEA